MKFSIAVVALFAGECVEENAPYSEVNSGTTLTFVVIFSAQVMSQAASSNGTIDPVASTDPAATTDPVAASTDPTFTTDPVAVAPAPTAPVSTSDTSVPTASPPTSASPAAITFATTSGAVVVSSSITGVVASSKVVPTTAATTAASSSAEHLPLMPDLQGVHLRHLSGGAQNAKNFSYCLIHVATLAFSNAALCTAGFAAANSGNSQQLGAAFAAVAIAGGIAALF
ncbi:hypothetical protein BDK51DRAFT_51294 [Blyttiomyces helicus]|uniref:Uncharacterized protein n=1 Tax=Blyttiomyces helicus TaxID=388810 RepID=A0A4P9VVS4_9FUNG|nr:hypothetical protein BDK51DRAFT_51294 [Blyttiomyces helicus]|eukprot:RKO82743.1 hypothetical protein BDK51DRAFT_51294 [Blyttiomyces helicus]